MQKLLLLHNNSYFSGGVTVLALLLTMFVLVEFVTVYLLRQVDILSWSILRSCRVTKGLRHRRSVLTIEAVGDICSSADSWILFGSVLLQVTISNFFGLALFSVVYCAVDCLLSLFGPEKDRLLGLTSTMYRCYEHIILKISFAY